VKPGVIISITIALAAACCAAAAATGLKATMKSWKADGGVAVQMANGRAAYDEAELRRILQGFVTDAQNLETRISGSTAQSKDVRSRFARFEADSTGALAALGKKELLRGAIATVMSNCRTCHDVYAN
jgi:cytochrome c556